MLARIACALVASGVVALAPAGALGATARDPAGDARIRALDIREVEAYAASPGVLVRVTLRDPAARLARGRLKRARMTVTLDRRRGRDTVLTAGGRGVARRTGPGARVAVVRTGKRLDFVLDGDGSGLRRVLVRTTPRPRRARAALAPPKPAGDRAELDLLPGDDACAALTGLAQQVDIDASLLRTQIVATDDPRRERALRKDLEVVTGRLAAITRRLVELGCDTSSLPPSSAPAPKPPPPPPPVNDSPPTADIAVDHGGFPEDAAEASAPVRFEANADGFGAGIVDVSWDFGDDTTGTGATVDHAFAAPGKYIVTVVATNDRGQKGGHARAIYVRGPGSKQTTLSAETGGDVPCPDTAETITVTVGVRVPSWAKSPFAAGFTIPAGGCPGADKEFVPGSLRLLQGNQGNHQDAWGRPENTLEFKFTVNDGGGTGSMNPGVTASWG